MNREIVSHDKIKLWLLILLFFIFYCVNVVFFIVLDKFVGIYIHFVIQQFVFLYTYIMFYLYWQMHRFEYTLDDGHLIIKEFLGKKERFVLIIPFDHIITVEQGDIYKKGIYHKVKILKKHFMKDTTIIQIEYDDYIDISMIRLQATEEFLKSIKIAYNKYAEHS